MLLLNICDKSIVTIIVRLQDHLQNAERSPNEVQHHVPDAPAYSALPPEVHMSLQTKENYEIDTQKTFKTFKTVCICYLPAVYIL